MKVYACLPRQRYERGDYHLYPVQPEHIERIREWRNAQMDVLRQTSILTSRQQDEYYAVHVWPDMHREQPNNLLMAYFLYSEFIGYGGLVNIRWVHRRAEISFLLAPPRTRDLKTYAHDFSNFLALMHEIAFESLGLHRLFTETYVFRKHHIAALERAGFNREGVMRDHVIINGNPVDSVLHGCLESDEKQANIR